MKMQDKELDDVFRSRLEGFEAEPSERVWTGIDEELDSARRRRMWIPILRIAAVLVIGTSVGLIFVLKHDGSINTGGQTNAVNTKVQPVSRPQKVATQPAGVTPAIQAIATKKNTTEKVENTIARIGARKKQQTITVQPLVIHDPGPEVSRIEEPVTLAAISEPVEIKHAVVPNTDVPLAIKEIDASTNIIKTKPAAIVQTPVADSVKKPKHRGIHSFGDLVNVVANKVDKRHPARMVDDDDNDSAIAMVNRGLKRLSSDRERVQQEQDK